MAKHTSKSTSKWLKKKRVRRFNNVVYLVFHRTIECKQRNRALYSLPKDVETKAKLPLQFKQTN